MTSGNESSRKLSVGISEAILVALTSAFSYLVAFQYEKGFASYFRIPYQLISVDLSRVLLIGLTLFAILIFAFPILNLLVVVFSNIMSPVIKRLLRPYLFIIFIIITYIYLYKFTGFHRWGWILIFLVIMIFLDFVLPLITQRTKGSYIDKLQAQDALESSIMNIPAFIRTRYGSEIVLLIAACLIGISLSYSAGYAEAVSEDIFLVTNTNPELVVLRKYEDKLICAPLNRTDKTSLPSFTILDLSSQGVSFSLERLGPLSLDDSDLKSIPTATPIPISSEERVAPTSTQPLPSKSP